MPAIRSSSARILFVEDYDINVAEYLVQGVDVWLNNPRRPLEASGTSGMKVVLNGGLNLSVLDGWWAEAYDGSNGFAIGAGESHVLPEVHDRIDGEALHRVLKEQVIPLYYQRDHDGLPLAWIARMKAAIRTLGWRFSANRMVRDYVPTATSPPPVENRATAGIIEAEAGSHAGREHLLWLLSVPPILTALLISLAGSSCKRVEPEASPTPRGRISFGSCFILPP